MKKEDLALFNEIALALLQDETDQPVSTPINVDKLYDVMDLELPEEGVDRAQFETALRDLVLRTPKTSSKKFFNQLFGGRQSESMVGDLLSVMLNNSMYTYKVAGPMVGVEKAIINQVCTMIDYPEAAGGTFATGGSMTNFMAMLMARDRADADIRYKGVQKSMTMYTSAESHYSLQKGSAFMGIGREQIRYIKVDAEGRMLASDLEAQVKQDIADGHLPFFVNATAGTTVLGAFDPVAELAPICKEYNLWLHVDGAYCGGVIFSEKYKHLVRGLEHTDSFSFNAHKMLNTTLTCSIIVTRDKKYLHDSFANDATYLYQTNEDEFNLGKISFQCGRRNDALKVWTVWKAIGRAGIEKMIEQEFYLADVARDYVRNHPDYTLYSFENSLSVCFTYKGIPADELCTKLYEHAKLMVGHGGYRGDRFIRFVTINASNEKEDILAFFADLEAFVAEHYPEA